MTVKEYLSIHDNNSIDSVGIYQAGVKAADPCSSSQPSDIIDAHATPVTIANHMEREIDNVHLWIYDDTIQDIYGKTVPVKCIRACIYVK